MYFKHKLHWNAADQSNNTSNMYSIYYIYSLNRYMQWSACILGCILFAVLSIAILLIVKEFQAPFNVMRRLNNFAEFYLTCTLQGTAHRCRNRTPLSPHTPHHTRLIDAHHHFICLGWLPVSVCKSIWNLRLSLAIRFYLLWYFIFLLVFFFLLVTRFFAGTHNENGFAQVFAAG